MGKNIKCEKEVIKTKQDTVNNPDKDKEQKNKSYTAEGFKYFHFDLSEKGHEVVIPSEDKSSWEQLKDVTWDPGRGD